MKNLLILSILFISSFVSAQITYDIYQNGVYKSSTTNTNFKVTDLQPATVYTFYIIAKDAAGNKSPISNTVTITTLPAPIYYCVSLGKSTVKEYIRNLQLNTFTYFSGNNNGYGDYTSSIIDLRRSVSNSIVIFPYWFGSSVAEYYRVWIDYNQDGDFSDIGEQVFTKSKTKLSSVKGSFIIPVTATLGTTRMRVSMKYNSLPSSCETFLNGEVEDYTINIK